MANVYESVGAMLVAVCRAHRNQAGDLLGEIGIYVGQEWILFQLRDNDGATLSELASSCDVELPTMSKALQRMEAAGLLLRRQDAADARVSRIFLSKSGKSLADQAEARWRELERRTVRGLSADERSLLRRLLSQVRDNLA
jgi:DNA-binding MarR family transcriptional regulator